MVRVLEYYINLDERGEFYADIRTQSGESIIEIDTDYAQFLSDEGVKLHNATSLREYFRLLGDLTLSDVLVKAN